MGRRFLRGKTLTAKGFEFIRHGLFTATRPHEAGHDLAPFFIGNAHHSDFRQSGVFQHGIFNLCREKVFAAPDNHLLHNRRPLLTGREAMAGVLRRWEKDPECR